jgi:hypothetical protein
MGANHKVLVESFRRDPKAATTGLKNAIEGRELKFKDFSLAKLFIECFGYHEFAACKEGKQLANEVFDRFKGDGRTAFRSDGTIREEFLGNDKWVQENQGAVTTAAFQNISGQIVYSTVLERYKSEEFVFKDMIPEVTATILGGEKIAGITELGDISKVRKEGDPYDVAGVSEDWIFTPAIPDRGRIVPITWEAIFDDRTGQLAEVAGDVGYWLGYGEEVLAIDCFVDENVTTHRYNWRGTSIATYGDNSGSHTWDNLAASNGLVDWTDIDAAEQVFNGLTNPYTGTPIMIEPTHIVVTKQLEQTARRIVSATEIRVATPGYATSANPTQTNMANPYANKYQILTSRLLASRMATDTTWFLADPKKLAKRMVAEPLSVVQAPSGTATEFHNRIVTQHRANKRYAHVVVQPRASVQSTVA